METGDIVRTLRKALDLTQQQLAKRAGMDRSTLTHVERGDNKARSYETRAQLARGFGLPIEQMVEVLTGTLSVRRALVKIKGLADSSASASS